MSIGKSSIARAAGAVSAAKPAKASADSKTKKAAASLETVFLELSVEGLIPCTAVPETEAPDELVRSVKKYGVLEPLIVCRTATGEQYLAAGCRRLAAAKQVGMATVPARVIAVADAKAAMKIYQTLSACSQQNKAETRRSALQDAKFHAAVSLTDDMPDYLL